MANEALQLIEERREKDDKRHIDKWIDKKRKSNAFWHKVTFGLLGNKEPTEEDAKESMDNMNWFAVYPSIWGHHTKGVCGQLISTCELCGNAKQIAVSTRDMTLLGNVLRK